MAERKNAPYALRPGDTVAAVLPAGPPDLERFDSGVSWLRDQGFKVQMRDDVRTRVQRYLAGSDDERFAELRDAYVDPNVRALYCGRGGYGAMRILDRFADVVRDHPPKLIIGFSDITALGCALWQQDIPWLHAPLLTTIASEPPETQRHMLDIVAGEARRQRVTGTVTLRSGRTEGKLIGGSLSLLSALCGTPYMPDLAGAILFLEDIGEKPYRLDRMWQQLRLAGALRRVKGVILGHFTSCDAGENGRAPAHAGADVMADLVGALNVPAAAGFAFGHEAPNFAIPFGAKAHFDADARIVSFDDEIVY